MRLHSGTSLATGTTSSSLLQQKVRTTPRVLLERLETSFTNLPFQECTRMLCSNVQSFVAWSWRGCQRHNVDCPPLIPPQPYALYPLKILILVFHGYVSWLRRWTNDLQRRLEGTVEAVRRTWPADLRDYRGSSKRWPQRTYKYGGNVNNSQKS